MFQHTNTYTTEKLYQYEQAQLKRNLCRGRLLEEAESAAEAEAKKQVRGKWGYMSKWLKLWRLVTSVK
ncbi:hypothetical protein [Paenibacillus montanisoli]|uniref:Uncharacterized protein n=1 Tax=Paenibacillus montanisoli TaxID=2081970 RepID=A0A328UBZ1_9BACL|nr:hypothetical protein [Paenibacillus montanisoli]RAP77516.1 hypothetical protein DL346_03285 [Paenibacillus montanisoli]